MVVYIAMGVKKPHYSERRCIKIGGISEANVREKLKKRYPDMGFQIETMDSFVRWASQHLSKYQLAEMVIDEMRRETNRGANWFYKYSSHTSTDRMLTKDRISKTEMANVESSIARQFGEGKPGPTLKRFVRRSLGRNLSTSKFVVLTVNR